MTTQRNQTSLIHLVVEAKRYRHANRSLGTSNLPSRLTQRYRTSERLGAFLVLLAEPRSLSPPSREMTQYWNTHYIHSWRVGNTYRLPFLEPHPYGPNSKNAMQSSN